MTARDDVERLTAMGMAVFPVDHPSLRVCIGRHRPDEPCDGKRGKHPVPWSWPKASSTDPRLALADLRRGPRNLGIDCGKSSLLILDEDEPGGLDRAAADAGASLPDTFTVTTGKGRHVYFRQPQDLPFGNVPGAFKQYGCDVRGRGGYAIAPGALHQSGRRYVAADWSTPILPIPGWVVTLLRPPVPPAPSLTRLPDYSGGHAALTGIVRRVLAAQEGERNGLLFWGSLRLFQRVSAGQLDAAAAESMMLDAAAHIGLGSSEARATIRSGRRAAGA